MSTTARTALRDCTWWPPEVERLRLLALFAVVVDVATTLLAVLPARGGRPCAAEWSDISAPRPSVGA